MTEATENSLSSARLYLLQRISAMVMAPLVILHLGVIMYAIRNGLDAAEILGRTRGSVFWGLTYGLFIFSVAIHAALGVRMVALEWLKLSGKLLHVLTWLVGLLLLGMGSRALIAVILG